MEKTIKLFGVCIVAGCLIISIAWIFNTMMTKDNGRYIYSAANNRTFDSHTGDIYDADKLTEGTKDFYYKWRSLVP